MRKTGIFPRAVRIVGALAVFAIGSACVPASGPEGPLAEGPRTELAIAGMTCTAWEVSVKKTLERVDGVRDVRVSFEKKKATVVYDPDKVTPEQLVEAVKKTVVFSARIMKE